MHNDNEVFEIFLVVGWNIFLNMKRKLIEIYMYLCIKNVKQKFFKLFEKAVSSRQRGEGKNFAGFSRHVWVLDCIKMFEFIFFPFFSVQYEMSEKK